MPLMMIGIVVGYRWQLLFVGIVVNNTSEHRSQNWVVAHTAGERRWIRVGPRSADKNINQFI